MRACAESGSFAARWRFRFTVFEYSNRDGGEHYLFFCDHWVMGRSRILESVSLSIEWGATVLQYSNGLQAQQKKAVRIRHLHALCFSPFKTMASLSCWFRVRAVGLGVSQLVMQPGSGSGLLYLNTVILMVGSNICLSFLWPLDYGSLRNFENLLRFIRGAELLYYNTVAHID